MAADSDLRQVSARSSRLTHGLPVIPPRRPLARPTSTHDVLHSFEIVPESETATGACIMEEADSNTGNNNNAYTTELYEVFLTKKRDSQPSRTPTPAPARKNSLRLPVTSTLKFHWPSPTISVPRKCGKPSPHQGDRAPVLRGQV